MAESVKRYKYKIALFLVILLALFLRLVNLNISPPGFNADEAALGYNAYSLLKTGKDEWGQSFPLVFKSFSDYKPGVYVYLDIPFVALFGLNELAVRLPSILIGTISVLFVFLLVSEVFRDELYALAAAFLLAVSPWHIHFSRGAWETNVATFFILLGVYAFIKSFHSHKWLFISSISLILSMYTYQSTRLTVPIIVLFILGFYFKKLFVKKNIFLAVVSVLLLIPFLFISSSSQGLARFQGLSIFNDPGPGLRTNVERGEHQNPDSFSAIIYHNKLIAYSTSFIQHYLDHFSPNFLFTQGDPLGRNNIPSMGEMYLFELVTILVGIYFLIKGAFPFAKLIWVWLLAAPVAAALTYQTPSALRAFSMVIPLTIISGTGMGVIIKKLGSLRTSTKIAGTIFGTVIVLFFIFRFFDLYFINLPKEHALEWEYGFSQVVPYVLANQQNYEKIKMTDRYDQPYILFLFYSKYNPALYQSEYKRSVNTKYGFSTITNFDKYEFGSVSKNEINSPQKTLIIGTPQELDGVSNVLYSVPFPDGQTAFSVTESSGK